MRARLALLLALVAAGYLAYTFGPRLLRGPDKDEAAPPSDTVPAPEPTPADEPQIPRRPISAPDGAEVQITLLGAPAPRYAGRDEDDDADETYRAIVHELRVPGLRYDRDLSRAAREVAYQSAVLGRPPPESAMTFLLHASGAPELSAQQMLVHTNIEEARALRDTIERAVKARPGGRGTLRIGVGEVSTPDEVHTNHIAVLLTIRDYEIAPTPRFAPPNAQWTLRGTLPADYQDATASALYPDGRIESLELSLSGRDFEVDAPTGADEGTLAVSISGSDRNGPGKLLQLTVAIAREPPRSTTVFIPIPEPEFSTMDAAEAFALNALNSDRERFGLLALVPDPQLAAIARAHSEEMRDKRYFAHLSPTTGLSSDRLAAAGYRSRTSAENIALNDSLGEAESSLLGSIGHRVNILSPASTHVGLGVARRTEHGRLEWHVTQLFATPVEHLDPDRAAAQILSSINAKRAAAGQPGLRADADLAAIAQRNAAAAAAGDLEGLARRVGKQVREFDPRSAAISVHAVYGIEPFEPPPAMLEPTMTAIGVGVVQSDTDLHGRIGIILIAASD